MKSITHDHRDRDAIRECAAADLSKLAQEFGAIRRGKVYLCPFHEDKTPSASVHRGRFHCFGCGIRLDAFEFLGKAAGMSFKEALEYLAARYCVPLTNRVLTPAERSQYLRQRAAADREAVELVAWRDGILELLRGGRDEYLGAYHRAKNHIIKHSMEGPHADLVADMADHYERKYLEMDERIAMLQRASWRTLRDFYRRTRAAEAA